MRADPFTDRDVSPSLNQLIAKLDKHIQITEQTSYILTRYGKFCKLDVIDVGAH